ncbi:YihY/virulence factor BrkB family protein, partial [Candidatus Omnitrophota bacterium]
ERSFNDIWGVKKIRTLGRRFSDYLSIMLLCPFLFVASSSITVFIATQIKLITEKFSLLGAFSPIIFFIVKLLPFCVIWILFTFIYIFMPNTKVNFKSGILAGVVAGTVYQLVQWAYINFQVGAVKYNAIYGSFAALPLFLVWLQLSWLVVFFGAEISFADQNVDMYEFEPDCLRASHSFKKLISLRVSYLLVKNFSQAKPALTANEISHILEIPVRLIRQILFELVEGGILGEAKTEEYKEVAYQPGRDTCNLTVKDVIDALETRGVDNIPVSQTQEHKAFSESLKAFSEVVGKSSGNKRLKEM